VPQWFGLLIPNVRVLIEIPTDIKQSIGLSSFAPTLGHIMNQRVHTRGLNIWVRQQVPLSIKQRVWLSAFRPSERAEVLPGAQSCRAYVWIKFDIPVRIEQWSVLNEARFRSLNLKKGHHSKLFYKKDNGLLQSFAIMPVSPNDPAVLNA